MKRPACTAAGVCRGFTLIELVVVLAITGILMVMAVPVLNEQIDKRRLVAVADAIYGDMQYARSEAIRNNQNVQISFSGGASWCYGMILGATACDCSVVASSSTGYCALKRVDYLDFQKVSIPASAGISFSGNKTGFDPVRGVALGTGHVIMESALGKQAQVNLALLGRISVCAPAGVGLTGTYPAC